MCLYRWLVAKDGEQADVLRDTCRQSKRDGHVEVARMSGDTSKTDGLLALAAARWEQAASWGRDRAELTVQHALQYAQQHMPLPICQISRRSALRVRVRWHGCSWPSQAEALHGHPSCELHLS